MLQKIDDVLKFITNSKNMKERNQFQNRQDHVFYVQNQIQPFALKHYKYHLSTLRLST